MALASLKDMREHIKSYQQTGRSSSCSGINEKLIAFEKFFLHYTVIENVVFPVLESKVETPPMRKIMWSFHDDIRRNVKLIEILETPEIDFKGNLTPHAGLVFSMSKHIILREEKIIFLCCSKPDKRRICRYVEQTIGIGLPYAGVETSRIK